jgi:hypothetical protein
VTASWARQRWIAAAAGALAIAAAAATALALRERPGDLPGRPPGERPELLLLTSLPIAFPERFTLEDEGSAALSALQSRYDLVPISTTDSRSLSGGRLLLMAQPHAQPAEMLVELDRWVRNGGHALVLADPALEWPSELPLRDLARPPSSFPDTGLLDHWGLRLDSPEQTGPATFTVGGRAVHALSPGTLVASTPQCRVGAGGLVARCTLGRGRATIVADADFVDVERRREPARSGNLDFLLAELARLEQ